jgi:DNA polymerase I-like protein with 3'-5' exonuclease and polymerase domains
MANIWVIDAEGDGLTPTKLYCLAACNPQSKKVFVTSEYDKMRKLLTEADVLICHNLIRFDVPAYERLLGIKIKCKLVDTLALSWYLYPNRIKHGLESHGEDLGIKKPEINDWFGLSQEEYEHRCSEDVKINRDLWNNMYRYLLDIYGSDKEIWRLLEYLQFKMHCSALQEKSRWKLDVPYVEKALNEFLVIQEEKKTELAKAMPMVPDVQIKERPKKFINKDGTYSKLGMQWISLLTEKGLPLNYEGTVEVVKGYEPGNPSSNEQKKAWLYSLGWEPQTFKETKNKVTGEEKSVPQINLEHGKGICPSVKKLYALEPKLELLEGLSVLEHRISILKGFLNSQQDGWIKAQINGLTNTLRFKHKTIVNLPKVDKLYAAPVRGGLICPDGYELCGSDMSSLEDRIKQHFIYPFDPEYVKEMTTDGYDPHLSLALLAGEVTQEQVDAYIAETDKGIKPIRDIFKNGNYSCQYGAGVKKLAKTAGISIEKARMVWETYWKKNWAIKKVASLQKFKTIGDQMWLFNPISKLWYSLRFEKDIFSTLVQGTASYVFDLWLGYILEEREQLTGQFHDEWIILVREGHRDDCDKLIRRAIDRTNEELKLNRELDISIQYGKRYSEIH